MTSWSESFNKADSTTLGPDQSWTEVVGNMEVFSNAWRVTSFTGSDAQCRFTTGTVGDHKHARAVIKTLNTPSSGNTYGIDVYPNGTQQVGVQVRLTSAGVFSFVVGSTSYSPALPARPFTVDVTVSNGTVYGWLNGTFIGAGTGTTTADTTAGLHGYTFNGAYTAGDLEVDSFFVEDVNVLPTKLTSYAWPSDGVGWVGPFISSGGNVYVVGAATDPVVFKATDPTASFATIGGVGHNFATQAVSTISAHQVGDTLHIVYQSRASTNSVFYRPFSMSTDTWGTEVAITSNAPVNSAAVCARRSNGDVVVFYNSNGVVNMSKTYGRIQARRIAGGSTLGATTDISIAGAATTLQTESVEGALLGSSDRIHLFWTQGASINQGIVFSRCVKSSDNLDGTAPATAAVTADSSAGYSAASADVGVHRCCGQPFMSSGNVLALATVSQADAGNLRYATASDADSPSWAAGTQVTAAAVAGGGAVGATLGVYKVGGVPYDGTNKTAAWIDQTTNDPFYDKDTGGGFGTDTSIDPTTAAEISANVFTRGSSVVLGVVYDQSGTYTYNEVVLRTTGTTVGPVTAVAATATVPAVTLVAPIAVSVSAVAATATVRAPAIIYTFPAVAPVAATASVPAVVVTAVPTLQPARVACTATVQTVVVQTTAVVLAGTPVVSTAAVPAVTVSTVASTTVTPSVVAAAATVQTVVVSATGVPAPNRVSVAATVQTVVISATGVGAPGVIAAVATVRTVTIVSNGAPVGSTVGLPAWRMVGWGGPSWWFMPSSQYGTEHGRGWGGDSVGLQHMGGATGLGGSYAFKSTSAAADPGGSGNQYYYQRMVEGYETDNANRTGVIYATANSMTSGIGFYIKKSGQDPNAPPLGGDWFNTTNRTNISNYLAGVAGFAVLDGLGEIHFDTEINGNGLNASGYAGDTHTAAQNRQAAFDFGKAMAQAVYAVKPDLDVAVYNWYSTDGWDGEVQNYNAAFATDYMQAQLQDDLWCGWFEGMRLSSATGYFYVLDAKWYRIAAAYIPGAVDAAAYKLDIERALAFLSRICKPGLGTSRPWASEALWSYVASHYRAASFTWRGTDGSGFYNTSQPDDTTWSTMAANARLYAMGPKRWEYTYAGAPWDESWYSGAGFISGAQAAASATAISTSQPTITSVTQNDNGGGSYTITCRAAHAYGVTHVDVYMGSTLLQTMKMTWNNGGGSVTTNFNSSYQDCTVTLTGRSSGDALTLVAYSAKDDVGVSSLTLTGGITVTPATVAATATVRTVSIVTAGAFDPTTLGTMQTWLDPSVTSSIASSAGAVSQINDLTGNGAHGTQSVAGNKPITGTRQINGLNGLDFDADDFLNLNISASDRTQTIFFVVQLDSLAGPNSRVVFDATAVGGRHVQFRCESGGNGGLLSLVKSGTALLGQYDTPGVPSTGVTYVCMVAISDTNVIFRINNNAEETDANSTTFTASLTSIIGSTASGWSIDGILGEVWVYDGQMGATNRGIGMTQLINKWINKAVLVNPVVATGSVPSVTIQTSTPTIVTPATVAATAAVPAVTITAVPTLQPARVAATATVQPVTITAVPTLQPARVSATVSVPAVTIAATATVTPTVVAATATVQSATISATATVTPATVAAIATVPAATVLAVAAPSPVVVAAVATVPSVTIVATPVLQPNVVAAVATVRSVTIQTTAVTLPNVVSAVATVQTVVVSTVMPLLPAQVAAVATVQPVTVLVAAVPSAGTPVSAVSTVRTVQINTTAVVLPAQVAATATVPAVTVSTTSATVVPTSAVAATASVPPITILATGLVAPAKVSAVATVQAATISTTAVISSSTVVATATVPAVAITVPATAAPNQVAATASVPPVTVLAVAAPVAGTPVSVVATARSVQINTTAVVVVAPVAATATVQTAVIQTSGTTTVPVTAVAATASVRSVTILSDTRITVSAVQATATVPLVGVGLAPVVAAVQAVATVQPVVVQVGSSTTVPVGPVQAVASVQGTTITAPVVAAPPVVSAVATVRTVTINLTGMAILGPVVASATVRAVAIQVSSPTTITLLTVQATATVRSVNSVIGVITMPLLDGIVATRMLSGWHVGTMLPGWRTGRVRLETKANLLELRS